MSLNDTKFPLYLAASIFLTLVLITKVLNNVKRKFDKLIPTSRHSCCRWGEAGFILFLMVDRGLFEGYINRKNTINGSVKYDPD